jgi:hypothetical protein
MHFLNLGEILLTERLALYLLRNLDRIRQSCNLNMMREE